MKKTEYQSLIELISDKLFSQTIYISFVFLHFKYKISQICIKSFLSQSGG